MRRNTFLTSPHIREYSKRQLTMSKLSKLNLLTNDFWKFILASIIENYTLDFMAAEVFAFDDSPVIWLGLSKRPIWSKFYNKLLVWTNFHHRISIFENFFHTIILWGVTQKIDLSQSNPIRLLYMSNYYLNIENEVFLPYRDTVSVTNVIS